MWHEAPAPAIAAPEPAPANEWSLPAASQLRALDDLVSLGYYRGIVRKHDEIVASDPGHAAFANHLRSLAQQFQLDAMTRIIRQARGDRRAAR